MKAQEGRIIVPNYSLQKPIAPPRMNEARVVDLVKNSGWDTSLFSHPYSVEYGSYVYPGGAAYGGPGLIDVWKITFSGLNIPRPAGRSGSAVASRPPPVTTLVMWVDDKGGTVLGADGH
ncbi:MAG: hypothetical protein ACRDFX_10300 [Chloroflexota bacterium]